MVRGVFVCGDGEWVGQPAANGCDPSGVGFGRDRVTGGAPSATPRLMAATPSGSGGDDRDRATEGATFGARPGEWLRPLPGSGGDRNAVMRLGRFFVGLPGWLGRVV